MRMNSKITLPVFVFFSLSFSLFIYWLGYGKPSYGIDDANIYFVYMKHFATGNGFVWNIGGEKVEGFTSLLWTIIGAFFYKLSAGQFTWLLLGLNFILTYITLYRLLFFVRSCNNTTVQPLAVTDVIIMALLMFPLGFIEWSILGLMETGLWIFLIVNITIELCNYYLLHKKINLFVFSTLLAIMIFTRPESILFGLLFIIILFIQQTGEHGIKKALIKSAFPALTYFLAIIAITAWRLSYFGYPFPNTYYAKVSGSLKDNITIGLMYIYRFFNGYPHIAFMMAILACFSLVLFNKWRKRKSGMPLADNDKLQVILITVVFCGVLLPVLTGGDHFKFSRFYQCIIPLACAAVLNFPFWKKHIGRFTVNDKKITIALTTAILVGVFFIAKSTWFDFLAPDKISANLILGDFTHAYNGRTIAENENKTFENCRQYPSIGLLAAGGFCYAYKGNTIDLMGLNSTIMAHATRIKQGYRNHASFDINGFWKLRPDIVGTFYGGEIITDTSKFILPENTDEFRHGMFVYTAYKKIFDYPEFIKTYCPALVRNKNKDLNYFVFAYYNKTFLSSLDAKLFQVIMLERKISALPAESNLH
jgi:arabinofuranosyltransferase